MLLTPVVDFNTAQTDQLKSARALGIPTGVCVASWDNLTNKGLIQIRPDLVTVWNEHQRHEAIELHRVPPERVVATGAQIFDEWFVRRPTTTRERVLSQGRAAGRPAVRALHLLLAVDRAARGAVRPALDRCRAGGAGAAGFGGAA